MAVCTGGSETKVGVADSVYITAEQMVALLPPPLTLLKPFYPYIPPILVSSLVDFCDVDPPGWPDFTSITVAAVLAGNAEGAALIAASALTQVILNAYWYLACQCSTMATPAPPAVASIPTGVTVINPPQIGPPTVGTTGCLFYKSDRYVVPGVNWDAWIIPSKPAQASALVIAAANMLPVPSGVSTYKLDWDTGVANGTAEGYDFDLLFFDANLASAGGENRINARPTGLTGSLIGSTPSTAKFFSVLANFNNGPRTPPANIGAQIAFFCAGQVATSPAVPCCPPDPNLVGLLAQIQNTVTLIQRQMVPFGYILGTAHPGLSGAGAISISGLIGVKVAVTTLPGSYGVEGTSPPEYFDLGFITFGTADGFPSAFRLTRNRQIMTPRFCSAYTDLDYDLAPGIVVTITELKREP